MTHGNSGDGSPAPLSYGILNAMAHTASEAVRNTYTWFHLNSGWAPPDTDTLDEWLADGVCRAPDECLVRPDSWCEHGLASWALVLEDTLAEERRDRSGRR